MLPGSAFALLPEGLTLEPFELVFQRVDLLLKGREFLFGMKPSLHRHEHLLRGQSRRLFEAQRSEERGRCRR